MSSSVKISKISSACLPRHNTAGTSENPPSEKLPVVKNSFHFLSPWFLMWRGSWFFDVEGRIERGQDRQEERRDRVKETCKGKYFSDTKPKVRLKRVESGFKKSKEIAARLFVHIGTLKLYS
jgi:hypothetical protein